MTSGKTPHKRNLSEAGDVDFIVQKGYEIVADQFSAFALPRGSPEALMRYHLAAHKAYYGRYNSIDYVRRTYSECWGGLKKYPKPYSLIRKGTSLVRDCIETITQKRGGLSGLPDHFGLVAAGAAMLRVETSFKAACVLCETTMGYEVFCLAKLIMEQISWACAVHKIEDRSLYAVKAPNCISHLKGLFPKAGRLYGLMNEQSHMDPKVIGDFLKPGGSDWVVVLRDAEKCLFGCLYLLILVDLYGAYMELIYRPWYTTFEFISTKTPQPKLKARRRSLAATKAFGKEVIQYLDHAHRAHRK